MSERRHLAGNEFGGTKTYLVNSKVKIKVFKDNKLCLNALAFYARRVASSSQ